MKQIKNTGHGISIGAYYDHNKELAALVFDMRATREIIEHIDNSGYNIQAMITD